MTEHVTPEKRIVICDCCNKNNDESPRKHKTTLNIKRDKLDFHDVSIADGSLKIDLCDSCANGITDFINKFQQNIIMPTAFIDIVFDDGPGHMTGRFVECENEKGESISIGKWVHRVDGYWALRVKGVIK